MAENDKIILYTAIPSFFSQLVRVSLHEMDIEFEKELIDITDDMTNYTEAYFRINPNMTVPTLNHKGKMLTDSNDIILFLMEEYPEKSLVPQDEEQKKQIMDFMEMLYANYDMIFGFTFKSFFTQSSLLFKIYLYRNKVVKANKKMAQIVKEVPETKEVIENRAKERIATKNKMMKTDLKDLTA